MDASRGSSSIEDVTAVEAPTVVVPEHTSQQQVPGSCQMATTEGGDCAKCGETRSLDEGLVEELNLVFERRLRIVEQDGNDIHFKISLYEDWVKQLRLGNLVLVGTIKEMQDFCSDRLKLMRANYEKNMARFGPETLRRLERDKNSLVEVIRRASTTGKWDLNGIKLYEVTLDQLFGQNNDPSVETPLGEKIEGPTISVNLEVSSNCRLENNEVEQLRQELKAKEIQIKHLEQILEQHLPVIYNSSNDTESEIRFEDCDTINKPLINRLRKHIGKKDNKLQQSARIDEPTTVMNSVESKISEMDLTSQFDSDLTQSLAEFKLEETDASYRKQLQQLQNSYRVKSEQFECVSRENEELRRDVQSLHAKVSKQSNRDNESLINEINDHHDKNLRLEEQIRDLEKKLRDANSAVVHRQKVINTLRQDKVQLTKALALAAVPGPACILQKSASNPNVDTALLDSSESSVSFISVSSDSSSATVMAPKSGPESELKAEQIQYLKGELATMSQQLQLFQQTKYAQGNIIAEQCARLDASGAELKKMRNDYENNKRKLCFIRAEMMRLIEEIVKNLKGHLKLPATVQSIDAFVSHPIIGKTFNEDQSDKDEAILECLKQYLDAIVKSYIVVTKEREDLCKIVDIMKEKINASEREKEQFNITHSIDKLQNSCHATDRKPSVETKEKETSIDFDIMPAPVDTRETLAAQRIRVQTVLHDMAVEIACLVQY